MPLHYGRQHKPGYQGREPVYPQAFPEGAAEFSHRGRAYRVESQNSLLTLYAAEGGAWSRRGEADSRARLTDLITAETGRYRWDTNTWRGNLPRPVDRLLRGEE